ncbi:SixA phosphatase family protein [Aurantibacillus circumpalustris]|uniref:SixA phosphatase family protein n=1 Tax=Aurantibacillus circumpalustris TaxID=3036359 RepID=UPI00295C3904|nr:histidine phosphatase family protein [Aurantibacillus circumpalustris]
MKEIILVRHAKSDWGTEFLKDVDRHLNERGYRDAYFLSKWYNETKHKPDLILSSTGIRALSTALLFARTMELEMKNFQLEKKIYEASVETLLSIITKQNDSKKTIMLFGHNPSITNLCNKLSDDLFFDDIPTCGIISYSFNVEKWSEVSSKKGKLNYYQFPKDFKIKD